MRKIAFQIADVGASKRSPDQLRVSGVGDPPDSDALARDELEPNEILESAR